MFVNYVEQSNHNPNCKKKEGKKKKLVAVAL